MNKKIKELAINEKDTGSSEVQVGLLTEKIANLSKHINKFKKDKHSSVGLLKAVNRRKKLLNYLKKNKVESYKAVISKQEVEVDGKKIILETGKIARQADGAIIATCGETVVIATAVGAKKVNPDMD